MGEWLTMVAVLSCLAAGQTKPAEETLPASGGLHNPFFAMDTATFDENHQTVDAQLQMVKELGFTGWAIHDTLDVGEVFKAMDALGLKLFTVYAGIDLDGRSPPWDAKLPAAIRALKGRDTVVWLYVISRKHLPGSEVGDELAVKAIRGVAAMASESGVAVSLYPHHGFYVALVRDALRLVRKVDRPNVGMTFNLCHWLRADGGKDLDGLLREARPHLQIVTINGADPEGDWSRVIQPLGQGTYDVCGFLGKLQKLGFRGPIGLQGYGIKGDVHAHLMQGMKAWRAYGERLCPVPEPQPIPPPAVVAAPPAATQSARREAPTAPPVSVATAPAATQAAPRDLPSPRPKIEDSIRAGESEATTYLQDRKRFCRVHRVEMNEDKVPIAYGKPHSSEDHSSAAKGFLNANTVIEGGFVAAPDSPAVARVLYCPVCREAKARFGSATEQERRAAFLKRVVAAAHVNSKQKNSTTLLHEAAFAGYVDIAQSLIARGADVRAQSDPGWTPLHQAAWGDQADMIELLIAAGADVNARTKGRETPLHLAAMHAPQPVIHALVQNGADVNARDERGDTPLSIAKTWNRDHPEVAKSLIEHGAK